VEAQFKLAAELIALRQKRGLTQGQLAARAGIQQSEISRIEGARGNLTVSTLSALAQALGAGLSIRASPGARGIRRVACEGRRRARRHAAGRQARTRAAQ
jgi:transcriptional regulator with XRE-family HTH domain